jgi:DNA-binding SARP family transcriptional activator
MSGLRISLFGKFCVARGQVILQGFDTLKVQELFCYLLLFRARPHPRESLASLLWGDNPTSQAKRYLSKALWQLQEALSPLLSGENLLVIEPDWIQLDVNADFWLDVAVFEQAYQRVRDVPGGELENENVHAIQEAIQWYRGDLLEGWYQDWCLCERERLQFLYLSLLDKLVRFHEAQGTYEAGRLFAYQILAYDRAREQTHRQLMRLYYLAGDRTGALRQYQQCKSILEDELGVEPSWRTADLYRKIHADEPVLAPSSSRSFEMHTPGEANSPFTPPDDRIPNLVRKLKHVRFELETMERDLKSLTRTIDRPRIKEA